MGRVEFKIMELQIIINHDFIGYLGNRSNFLVVETQQMASYMLRLLEIYYWNSGPRDHDGCRRSGHTLPPGHPQTPC